LCSSIAFHGEISGVSKYRLCSLAQYINLVGVTIGYTITTAISMGYVR
jgi:hypothetical protein